MSDELKELELFASTVAPMGFTAAYCYDKGRVLFYDHRMAPMFETWKAARALSTQPAAPSPAVADGVVKCRWEEIKPGLGRFVPMTDYHDPDRLAAWNNAGDDSSHLAACATSSVQVPLTDGGSVNAGIDAAIYALRDKGFRVHRAAVVGAIEAFMAVTEPK